MAHPGIHKPRFTALLTALLALAASASAQQAGDSVRAEADTARVDTLRELVVRPDSTLQVVGAVRGSLSRQKQPRVPSLGDVLDKIAPGLNDKITHPFAIKDRRRERKHRRDRDLLDAYDRARTPNDLLEEALRREGLEHVIEKKKE